MRYGTMMTGMNLFFVQFSRSQNLYIAMKRIGKTTCLTKMTLYGSQATVACLPTAGILMEARFIVIQTRMMG
jgi:hypothetical protein